MAGEPPLPDPALVVLVGPSGAGKSTWAQARYRQPEIVSADDLRGVVGSGRHDLDASSDAFQLLDLVVAGRLRRGLTTVVDTLGLDTARRRGYLGLARARGLPAVVVAFAAPDALCRVRNAARDRPVPGRVLAQQQRTFRTVLDALPDEGWTHVVRVVDSAPADDAAPRPETPARDRTGLEVVLQLSRFPWGGDPAAWLRDVALAADEAGFAGIALMDHLIQIPQVGSAWEPIPEPWVTLGMLAGLDTRLRLGTLVTPVTFRRAGITAKTVATLDSISGAERSSASAPAGGSASTSRSVCRSPAPPSGSTRSRPPSRRCAPYGPRGPRRMTASGSPCPRRRPTHGRSATSRSSSAAAASAAPCGSRPGSATAATFPPTSTRSTGCGRCCAGTASTWDETPPRWP